VILLLFGAQFSESITVFYWLLPGVVAWSTIYVTWNNVSASGRPELGIPIFGSAALLDTVLNVILLPRLGVAGAGIAATSSYWLAAALFLAIFCKQEKCSVWEATLVSSQDLRQIMSIIFEIFKAVVERILRITQAATRRAL
jgi:O-antigen/teichoic acid export membrane protein